MAHKTLTISEEAYKRLLKEKMERESFTDVVIRLTNKEKNFFDVVRKLGPDKDLADSLERVYKQRKNFKMRDVKL